VLPIIPAVHSQVLRREAGAFRNAGEHARADFLGIVKGEDEIRPPTARERFVGAGFSLELPTNAIEGGEHTASACGRPISHAGAALRSAERHANEIRARFGMLQAIGQDTKGKRLCARDGLIARLSVSQDADEVRNLSDPAAVLLAISLDGEMHTRKGSAQPRYPPTHDCGTGNAMGVRATETSCRERE
jgi:hypothetical protein